MYKLAYEYKDEIQEGDICIVQKDGARMNMKVETVKVILNHHEGWLNPTLEVEFETYIPNSEKIKS